MDVLDDVRPRDVQDFRTVLAPQVVGLDGQGRRMDHGAHGPVEDEDTALQGVVSACWRSSGVSIEEKGCPTIFSVSRMIAQDNVMRYDLAVRFPGPVGTAWTDPRFAHRG